MNLYVLYHAALLCEKTAMLCDGRLYTSGGPIMSIIMPPIIFRIAITITPVGLEVAVAVNLENNRSN